MFFTPRGKPAWDVLEMAYSVIIVDIFDEKTVMYGKL